MASLGSDREVGLVLCVTHAGCLKAVPLAVVCNRAWVDCSVLDVSAAVANTYNFAVPGSNVFSKTYLQPDVLFHSSSKDHGVSLIVAKEWDQNWPSVWGAGALYPLLLWAQVSCGKGQITAELCSLMGD